MGKVTGFMEYDRQTEAYRDIDIRIKDYNEVFAVGHNYAKLQIQAARCMDCGVPFCQSNDGCPVSNLIPEFNDLVYRDKWFEAFERLKKTNNFPEFTGRVCPAPCEGACVLSVTNPAVTIKNIEMAIADMGFKEGWEKKVNISNKTGKKIAIVGSGPTGLAASEELNKMGHNVVVFERDDRVGGLLMYGIPNMKLNKNIVNRRVNLLKESGIEFITNADIGKNINISNIEKDFDVLLFATGATKPRNLEINNNKLNGVYFAMDYLNKNTKNLLDFNKADDLAKGKNVIIIGGGDTGTDCIATAIRQGAKSVVNFELMQKPPKSRGDNNPWPSWPHIYRVDYGHEEAEKTYGKDPRTYQIMTDEFIDDGNGNIKAIKTHNVELVDNKFSNIANSEKIWHADLVLLSMGFISPEHYLSNQSGIELDERGNYQAEYGCFQTNKKNIFVAGDCRRGQSLVVWAINEGREVAKRIDEFLKK